MKRTAIITAAALLLTISMLAGCTAQAGQTVQGTNSDTPASNTVLDESEMFTDRDKEIGYSESDSTIITLEDGASSAEGSGVLIAGDSITLSKEGTYIFSGSLSNGQITVSAPDDAKVQLVLDGADISNGSSAAIYVKSADKVFITTAEGTENKLSVTGEYVAIDDNNIDAALFSKEDLTLNGAGTLIIDAAYGHGVVSKDDLVITCGTYEIRSADHGLSGKDSVRIADGNITINSTEDGIHSENNDDTALGFVYIAGGTISISTGDDGIHAGQGVTICGGVIDIAESYEGIEGLSIDISGGDIRIVSSDDGLNAAGGSESGEGMPQMRGEMADPDCYINISGGSLTIDASGDGIDSNGDITISGGTITVSGPTSDGNGTLDYGGTAEIRGGRLLGAGSGGMAMGFSDSSSQCSILYILTASQPAGTTVTLKDESGNILAEFSPSKEFRAVNLSVPELEKGKTYILCAGSEEYSVELTESCYSNGGINRFGGMGNPGAMGAQPPQGGKGLAPAGGMGQIPERGAGMDADLSEAAQK